MINIIGIICSVILAILTVSLPMVICDMILVGVGMTPVWLVMLIDDYLTREEEDAPYSD